MSHEFFRYLIPGIVFYLPLYFWTGWKWLNNQGDPHFDSKEYVAFLSVLVMPTGWLVYSAWRAFWQLGLGGYEKRHFLDRVREVVPVYDQEDRARTVVDFSQLLGEKVGMRWFSRREFDAVFDPFKKFPSLRFKHPQSNGRRRFLHFVEPVSDLVLFNNASYDYARSISSARYSIWVSLFSLGCGSLLAFAVRAGDIFPNHQMLGRRLSIGILFAGLGILTGFRMRMARTEHEARVQLITQINSADRLYEETEITAMLEPDILMKVQQANNLFGVQEGQPKLAAFDMDGTLIRHDMGDAVLAQLIKCGKLTRADWNAYQEHLSNSRPKAYEYAVTVMQRLSVKDIYRAAYDVFDPRTAAIDLPGNLHVPKPEVVPKMQALVMWLHRHKFEVYVVTATNQWAAEVVASDFFGIPAERVIGVKTEIKRSRLTDKVCRPAPIGDGKSEAWKMHLKEKKPLIGAGDSKGDYALLKLVESFGLVLWAGSHTDRPDLNNVLQINTNRPEPAKPLGQSTAGGV
jgi:phosphoserine phosphatase